MLPAGFDSWLTRAPEYPEQPCEVSIEKDYDCSVCGCPFDKGEVVAGNYECELDDDHNKWSVKHIECPPDEEVA